MSPVLCLCLFLSVLLVPLSKAGSIFTEPAPFKDWGGVVASFYFSYLDLDLPRALHRNGLSSKGAFLLEIAMESESNDIIFWDLFIRSQEKPFEKEVLRKQYSEMNMAGRQRKCFVKRVLSPFGEARARAFTHFDNVSSISLSVFILRNSLPNELISINSEPVPLTIPIMHYRTVFLGKKLFNMDPEPQEKRLQFDPIPEYIVRVKTIPRSGTHMFANTLSRIMEEYVVFFSQATFISPSRAEYFRFSHQVKGFHFGRVSFNHAFVSGHISSRVIHTIREPVNLLNSYFSTRLHSYKYCRYSLALPGYEKDPKFPDFISEMIQKINNIYSTDYSMAPNNLFVRMEDMTSDAIPTFCGVLSFLNGFPCEHSLLWRVKEVIESQGLRSDYKNTTESENKETEKSKRDNYYQAWGKDLVSMLYNDSRFREIIYFFEYSKHFTSFLGIEENAPENAGNFREHNQRTLSRIMRYTEEIIPAIKEKKIQEVFKNQVKLDFKKEFEKYKTCWDEENEISDGF